MGLQPIILIPLFVSLVVLMRKSVEKAVLNVYLPVILLLPLYKQLKLPGLPPLTFADTAIFPIGIWLLATKWRNWKFTRMDFWMLLFGLSSGMGMFLRDPSPTNGIFGLFGWVTAGLFPYAIGKLLIEQEGMRVKVMKRIVFLLALVGVFMLYEYRMGANPLHDFWAKIFPPNGHRTLMDLDQFEQYRWGFTRAAGPYFGSELAGMVYIVGTIFAFCIYKNKQWEKKFRWRFHPFQKGTLIFVLLCIGMFVTQARGPYLGVVLAFLIARIFTARRLKRATVYTLLFLGMVALPAYNAVSNYASANNEVASGDQQNAVYRTIMIDNYVPEVERGGLFGWGDAYPIIDGQVSIDNEFLLLGLAQGYLGVFTFSLLIAEALLATFLSLQRVEERQDIGFVFCLGGAIVGITFCIGTVALFPPVFEIFFLMIGWSQSIRRTDVALEATAPIQTSGTYQFRRVFT